MMAEHDRLAISEGALAIVQQVMVRDLTVVAEIGVNADEIGRRQPLTLDIVLDVAPPAGDRLDATVDYRELVCLAEALAEERFALIETFAYRLATACLKKAGVLGADITISKPRALVACKAMTRISLRRAAVA